MIVIFLFYNVSTGIQADLAFSKIFRHCNIITYDGEFWINYELDLFGIHARVLKVKEGNALIRGLKIIKDLIGMIVVWIDERAKIKWFPWWVRSCNEFNRYIGAVDIGFTFNPRHLYKKLLKYDEKRNYKILHHWRREDGILRR